MIRVPLVDAVGWTATALFATSYFCTRPSTLRRVQGGAALVWMVYGLLLHALPVIVANVLVAGLAVWSSFVRAPVAPVSAPTPPSAPSSEARATRDR